jgi:diacylglycerol kinase
MTLDDGGSGKDERDRRALVSALIRRPLSLGTIQFAGHSMPRHLPSPERSWASKFRDAFRGVKAGVRGQSSFQWHVCAAGAVVAAAAALGASLTEWCLLLLCITIVLTAEMFNSALESMAKSITGQSDPHLGNSLDIGSAAVLLASMGAAVVGTAIFLRRLGILLGWW